MAKKPQIPVWIISMSEPFPHEHETPVDPVTGDLARARDRAPELRLSLVRQNLVRIEDEDPLVAKGQIFQGPVFLLRPGAVELELHDLRAQFFRDPLGPVAAL